MPRRLLALVVLLSALGFAAMAACVLRGWVARDDFTYHGWDPAASRYTEARVSFRGTGVLVHWENTPALATDDTSAVRAKAGPSGSTLSYVALSPSRGGDWPVLWADHYHCTPLNGLNPAGLSDCRTLEFRPDVAALVLAVLPAVWFGRRLAARRRASDRGFSVVGVGPHSGP